MSIEFLSELETKIDVLIKSLAQSREEVVTISTEFEKAKDRITELELENMELKSESESIRSDVDVKQDKINSAAQRIQDLISKLDTVQ